MEHMEHNLSKYNILKASQCFKDRLLGTKSVITIWCQKFKNLKVGSLFALDNSEPKIIFLVFFSSIFCHFLVLSKNNFFDFFFLDFFIFLVYSKSWLIIRFRQF